MALRIVLNVNAEFEVLENFYIRTPLGRTIHFQKGQIYSGQFDQPESGFWIKHEDYVANIPIDSPIKINQYEEAIA